MKDTAIQSPKIVFFMPGLDASPNGGFKIVYEYANRFAADGFSVTILYPEFCGPPRKNTALFWLLKFLKRKIVFMKNKITARERHVPEWFALDPAVQKEYVWRFRDSKTLRESGVKYVATALPTSFELAKTVQSPEQNKYYFVQGFESWWTQSTTDETVYDSYRLPLKKITIAPWLVRKIESAGEHAVLVENGLDFNYFNMTVPIESRSPYEIAMLYHVSEHKGTDDALAAIEIVKEKIPALHVTVFGTFNPPDLPPWFTYFQSPDREQHNSIYNNAAVFVAPSRLEGMGLTPAEAMMCGCAVACTDNPGFEIFSRDNDTTLVSKARDVNALAANILRLIEDNTLRLRIAAAGHAYIRQFTWERAYAKFKAAVELE